MVLRKGSHSGPHRYGGGQLCPGGADHHVVQERGSGCDPDREQGLALPACHHADPELDHHVQYAAPVHRLRLSGLSGGHGPPGPVPDPGAFDLAADLRARGRADGPGGGGCVHLFAGNGDRGGDIEGA